MGRVKVFLKDQLIDQINEEAREEGTNRSALIQTALEKYIEGKRRERDGEEKRKKMQEASRKMERWQRSWGNGI